MKEMQICNRCLNNKDPVPPGKAHAGCAVTPNAKKAEKNEWIRYHACNEEECLESFLLCDSPVHMTKNQIKLNKCKEKWKERDIQFSVNLVRVGSNLSRKKKSSEEKAGIFGADINTNNEEENEVFEDNTHNEEENEVFKDNTNKEEEIEVFEVNINKNEEDDYINLKTATERLRQVAKGSEVIDVPEGEPLFLFSSAVGKTRPINVFYDKGCSHVVFRDGVPQHELTSVMTKKGPLTITNYRRR